MIHFDTRHYNHVAFTDNLQLPRFGPQSYWVKTILKIRSGIGFQGDKILSVRKIKLILHACYLIMNTIFPFKLSKCRYKNFMSTPIFCLAWIMWIDRKITLYSLGSSRPSSAVRSGIPSTCLIASDVLTILSAKSQNKSYLQKEMSKF